MGRWARFFTLSTMACVLVWWGCHSDGQDSPAYAPSGPGLPIADGAAPPNGGEITGPVVPSRVVVHVPRGETHEISVNVDPAALKGLPQLTATLASPDLTVAVRPDGANRFILTFVAKPDANAVDAKVPLHAATDRGEEIGTIELRALVGVAGAPDVSFGENGVLKVPAPVESGAQFAVVDGSVLIAGGNHDVVEVFQQGPPRTLFSLDLAPDCTVKSLAADRVTVLVSGFCGTDKLFVAEGPRSAAANAPPVPTIPVTAANVFAVSRAQDAGFYLTEATAGSSQIVGVGKGPLATVPLEFPMQLLPGATGFFVLAHDGDNALIARVTGTPLTLLGAYGDGGISSVPVPRGDGNDPVVNAVVSTSGRLVMATSIDSTAAPEDRIFLHSFTSLGELAGTTEVQGVSPGSVAADSHDRVVLAAASATDVRLKRFYADAAADEPYAASVAACAPSAVGVDEEGMIVVLCGGPTESILHRFWP
jgi:hypothetical protein